MIVIKVGEYHAGHNEDLGPLPQMSRSANFRVPQEVWRVDKDSILSQYDCSISAPDMIRKSSYGDETTTEYGQLARLMNDNKAGKR